MAGIDAKIFAGILPRVPESLLPASAASAAKNCEFAYGELQNLKGDFFFQDLLNAAQSVYTEDGTVFYSWPFEANAERSPLAVDTFDRLYFTTPSDFRVTTRAGMRIGGGEPGSSYRVGVPAPKVAPKLTAAAAPSLTNATVTTTFYYEYSGVQYQEQPAVLSDIAVNSKWRLTVPARLSSTPEQAFPVLRMVAKSKTDQSTIFSVYSLNSSLASSSIWKLTLLGDAATGEAPQDGVSTLLVNLAASYAEADQETTAVVYTYVNTYGEEGPPSPATLITYAEGAGITAQMQLDSMADYAPIKEMRLYRTVPGSNIADYFYSVAVSVLNQAPGLFSVTDTTKAGSTNEVLSSTDSYPPDPALVGLMMLPNGIMCARKGNQLHFSEAYRPWSWPPAYVKTYQHGIVGAIVWGSGALVTTTVSAFFVSGITPDSMTESKLGMDQGGVSRWSIAEVGGILVYASNDGIVAIDGGRASMALSEKYFTRDVWRARYRAGFSTMRFAVWDGRLVVYSSTNAFIPFMLRFDEAGGQMTELPAFRATCSFVSPLSDQFYYALATKLYQFAGGSDLRAEWVSREFSFPKQVNLGAARVRCTGAWLFELHALNRQGVFTLRKAKALTGDATFRLPAGYLADRYKITLTGTGRMRQVSLTETTEEMKRIA